MRDAVINAKLDHFRVDEQQFYSCGVGVVKNADDQELMQTDLPEPVEPAIRVCGIFARSATVILPAISRQSNSQRTFCPAEIPENQ